MTDSKVRNFLRGGARADARLGHGPFGEQSETWVDAKPYVEFYSNGLFEGYDGSVWRYYRFPEDVQTEWLLDPEQGLENQAFFVHMMRDFGQLLEGQSEKVRNDVRRDWHIQVTQHESAGIEPPATSSAAHAEYLSRVSSQYTKPVWHGFFGVRLLPSDIFYEAHGFTAKLVRYLEAIRNPTGIRWTELRRDLDDVDQITKRYGMRELNLAEDPEALAQLTAWHGISDDQYGLPRQLQNVRMKEPVQGLSIITPKWGEIQFHAMRPQTGMNLRDPLDEAARWAKPLYTPGSNVVLINLRGQVRAPKIADNLLDTKKMRRQDASARNADDFAAASVIDTILYARVAVNEEKLPFLDNTEIIVGTVVPKDGPNPIVQQMRNYGWEAQPLIGRQALGVLTSFPCYPRHVLRVPRGNAKRPELTNAMLPGLIAMSGIFRSTKPCGPGGILVGLSDAGDEYREIYTETDAASKYNRVPGMLVTGRPGAGKTQFLLQTTVQMAYQGLPVAFFNPKKEGTLQSTFDHIGGVTISMNRHYLADNPGMLDPKHFLDDPVEIGALLADAIFTAGKLNDDAGSGGAQRRTKILTEIVDRAKNANNRCSWDIIFGNDHADERLRTTPLSDGDVLDFVRNRTATSPFWQAFVSRSVSGSSLRDKLRGGRSFLIEWDKSMSLPDVGKDRRDYTDTELDTVLSVNVTFNYASAIISGSGGAIIVDESWVLKNSKEALAILERGGREWRQANIMLIMATQRIQDWLNARAERGGAISTQNMATFFDRYYIMAINEQDTNEMDAFYDLTKQPRTRRIEHYLTHAGATTTAGGAKGNSIPRAFYMDKIYGWAGGVISGPWPELELNLGRTDKAGLAAKAAGLAAASAPAAPASATSLGGALAAVKAEERERERDLAEAEEPQTVPA